MNFIKNISNKNWIILTWIASFIIFFASGEHLTIKDGFNAGYFITYFIGYNFVLTISSIIYIFKKYSIKPVLIIHIVLVILSIIGNNFNP